jgi:endogenous inhibitor of DNA gyrase (YacG/DUF329 family)
MPKAASPDSCPLCGKPATPDHKPFCSRGCRDRDLLNWLGDGYRVPGRPVDEATAADLDQDGDGGLDR